jgi:nucleoid-associated protein YgaU
MATNGAEKGPRKSPFALVSSLFKRGRKVDEAVAEPTADAAGVPVAEETAEEVVITLPVMATIDPAGLAEFGLDPSTLEAMGLDPATLPQFDPEFLTELGINPNIVVELIRRQYYPQSGSGAAASRAGRKINVKRVVHIARRWAPAAAATVGLTATGAIWFMASGSEKPGEIAEVTQAESGEATESAPKLASTSETPGTAEPPAEAAKAAETVEPSVEVAKAAEPSPPAAVDALPALAAGNPSPEVTPLPTDKPAESPADSAVKIGASEPGGLPALPGGTPEGLPGIAAANEAPPLPTASALPPVESAPPLPPGENSLPPVADTTPATLPKEAVTENNALPPIAGLTAAAAGAGAKLATDGLKEAPPLAAAAKPGEMPALPGLPEAGGKVEPPPLTGDLAKDESVASAQEPPGLPPLGSVPEPSIKPEAVPSTSNNTLAKGLAGLAAGIGGAKVANDLAKSGDKPTTADLKITSPPPTEPVKAAAEAPADLPGSLAAKNMPEAPVSAPEPPGLPTDNQPKPMVKAPAASLVQESEPSSSLKNTDSPVDAKSSAAGAKSRAGLPVAQADWPTIPNGKGRVLRSIATPARNGANTIAMAGATATGVGLGMAASGISNASQNSSPATMQPISSTDIAPIRHVVQSGENFWTISRDYYGSGRYYKALWSANRQKVAKIDQLHVGDSIRIPAMESLDKSLIDSSGIAGKKPAPDEKPEAVARSLDSRAVRTGNEIESTPTEAPVRKKAATASPESNTPGEIISQPVGETAARTATGNNGAGRRHRVQQGETLRTIARDYLGDARRSQEIVDLNNDVLDDSRTPIRPGQVLRMPSDSTETEN